jgi:hypothetical protein
MKLRFGRHDPPEHDCPACKEVVELREVAKAARALVEFVRTKDGDYTALVEELEEALSKVGPRG